MKLVIVGGVAGGASAAARARRLSEDARIVLSTRSGPLSPTAACPTTSAARSPTATSCSSPSPRCFATASARYRPRTDVEAIDRARKVVRVRSLAEGRVYEETYDKLILATGARRCGHRSRGSTCPASTRCAAGGHRPHQGGDRPRRGRAVMVGAGFIGLELVENLVRRGVATTLIELQDQVLPPLDKEMTADRRGPAGPRCRSPAGRIGRGVRAGWGRTGGTDQVGSEVAGGPDDPGHRRAARERPGDRGRARRWSSRRDSGGSPSADLRPGHLRRRGRRRGPRLRHRGATQVPLAGPANRQGRIAADHIFGATAATGGPRARRSCASSRWRPP